jgi:DNA-binding SARP family transcriptional activator
VEFSIGSLPRRPARVLPVRRWADDRDRPSIHGRLLGDVFDVFPTGIMVLSEDKRVLAWNPAAAELLGDQVGSAATCCALFGCRTPGTALGDRCVTELALARDARLELDVELSSGRGNEIAIVATPFSTGSGRSVVLEMRTVEAAAVAPITTPPQTEGSIYIRTLGETVVETSLGEIRGGWLDQRPGLLLKFLVVHRYTPVHADTIAEGLWPQGRADTTNTVRHLVHVLREKLEPRRARYERSEFVIARNGGYSLNPERVSVDADDFERKTRDGLVALAANEREVALDRLRSALELYRGDFLPDAPFDDWAIEERERLRDLAGKPLRELSELTDDADAAATYLERLAGMEPLDVDIHRDLIAAWLRQGRRGRALRHYRVLQSRLMRELGERVTFDLGELARQAPST